MVELLWMRQGPPDAEIDEPPPSAELTFSLDALPVLPEPLAEILRIANNPSADALELELLIARDGALTSHVFRIANSPVFGFKRRLSTIREAVVALGARKVRAVASTLALAPLFATADRGLVSGPWLLSHALATALWSAEIANRVAFYDTNLVYTAGLMHDLGLVVLNRLAPERLEPMLRQSRDERVHYTDLEREHLGTTHGKIGAALCAKWMLPAELTVLISHHHDRSCPVERPDQVLRLADHVATRCGLANFPWDGDAVPPLPEGLLAAMDLNEHDVRMLEGMTPRITEHVALYIGQ